ncbi:hypothetical protein DVH24_021212 [Malus domestica]|uniref:Uncharacterized protein n=1 Tax=Malus domestica TaxID=3750 RepID=A0A498KNV1_MALDO|nr:hypothetical protein DVH24_021212 [Malus domestica]
MVATFLLTIGQNSRYCQTRDTFRRSHFTTSKNFNNVLKALNTIAPDLMVQPGSTMPTKIRENTRFYPYFKLLLHAIDTFNANVVLVLGQVHPSGLRVFFFLFFPLLWFYLAGFCKHFFFPPSSLLLLDFVTNFVFDTLRSRYSMNTRIGTCWPTPEGDESHLLSANAENKG